MIAVTLAAELLLMNLIGFFILKLKIVKESFISQLTNLIMKVCVPCLIFSSVSSTSEFSLETLSNCALVICMAAITVLLSLLIGQICFLLAGRSGFGRVLRYSLTFTQFSFMGLPVIEAFLGQMGTFYYTFFLLPIRIMYYTFSEPLMTPPELRSRKRSLPQAIRSNLLTPASISMILGLLFWVCGWRLPTILNYCVTSLRSLCTPLALILCGMLLARSDLKQTLRAKLLLVPLLRTICMPALFMLISLLLNRFNVNSLICSIAVLYSALPVAALLPVYTIQYDPDRTNQLYAVGASTLSLLCSIVTIPCFSLLLGLE